MSNIMITIHFLQGTIDIITKQYWACCSIDYIFGNDSCFLTNVDNWTIKFCPNIGVLTFCRWIKLVRKISLWIFTTYFQYSYNIFVSFQRQYFRNKGITFYIFLIQSRYLINVSIQWAHFQWMQFLRTIGP